MTTYQQTQPRSQQSRIFSNAAGSTFLIERNVPLPNALFGSRVRNPFTDALIALEPGESVVAPNGFTGKNVSACINSAKYFNDSARYAMRSIKDLSAGGFTMVRVWRMEDGAPKTDTNK